LLCGANGEGSCQCGAPYVPAGLRAAQAIAASPDKSDRAIAQEIGVGRETVRRARKSTAPHEAVAKRTGKDGKSRELPRKAKAVSLPTDPIQEPCFDWTTEQERWQRSLTNLAGDAISMPAFWTCEFGKWENFAVQVLLFLMDRSQEAR
jgi:hypothetical protein